MNKIRSFQKIAIGLMLIGLSACKKENELIPELKPILTIDEVVKEVSPCLLNMLSYVSKDKNGLSESNGSGADFYFISDTSVTFNNQLYKFIFDYDSNGFIQSEKKDWNTGFYEEKYFYLNEKMIRKEYFRNEEFLKSDHYEYDSEGFLILSKVATFFSNQSHVVKTYQNEKMTSYKVVYNDGMIEDFSSNFNSSGFIIKSFYDDIFYFYDDFGNQTRMEFHDDFGLKYYKEYDYDLTSTQRWTDPRFKGHPILSSNSGSQNNLLLFERRFDRLEDGSESFDQTESTEYTYVKSEEGLILEKRINTTYPNGNSSNFSAMDYFFSYQDCH